MSDEHRGDYRLSTDRDEVDVARVREFLAGSYWAKDIPLEVVQRAVEGSLPFSIHHASEGQVAFARVVTDRATFAYLADVFVLPKHRGRGLSTWLMDAVFEHPELQDLRRWMLVTRDAHGLYERYGFRSLAHPDRVMERHDPEVYQRAGGLRPSPEAA
jgi:GNAT superfamily N-acetyltransferase